jgi:hypothetical protein
MASASTQTQGLTPADYEVVLQSAGFVASGSASNGGVRYELAVPIHGVVATVDFDPADPSRSAIVYHRDINSRHRGTLSFRQEENVVSLCCVSDLLKRGYAPACIELEKTWQLGRQGNSGRLDIMVYRPDESRHKKSWAMIECKTWKEYPGALEKIVKNDTGQLLSYFVQDRDAKFLYLYACRLVNGKIESRAEFIDVRHLDKAGDIDAIHASWDKTFGQKGLFHPQAVIYTSDERLLTSRELGNLDRAAGEGLFNRFAEAIRRHSISDKSNAFNKLFNLFVCKIVDEDNHANDDEPLEFQAPHGIDPRKLVETLDGLYRQGLKKYLEVSLDTDYVAPVQNFAFLEVYGADSFEGNFKLLREVVRMFQPYRLKYTTRQQHLGDFFEKLLHNSVKQEAGQFFTPVPLATFAVKSLPMAETVLTALDRGGDNLFPRILDYACGSGHFLTEAMLAVQGLLDKIDAGAIKNGRDRARFERERRGYDWARDGVYGTDLDYRLAKVTKVATFLNGDGEATILHADGLAPFSDPRYKGALYDAAGKQANPRFDVLVANPPYAVSNFLEHSPAKTPGTFDLFPLIKYQGDEIECLFVERAAQVLREGGVGAIILPAGFFSKQSKVHNAARLLLLKKFKIRGAVSFGSDAFAATGVLTAMIFVERRSDTAWRAALMDVAEHHEHPTAAESQEALRLLCRDETTVLSATGKGQAEKDFIGYQFSNRRGQEGILDYGVRSLYSDVENVDRLYLADLIRANFRNNDVARLFEEQASCASAKLSAAPPHLKAVYNNTKVVSTERLLGFTGGQTTIEIGQHANEMRDGTAGVARLIYPYLSIGDLLRKGWITIQTGKRPTGGVARLKSGVLSLGGEHLGELKGNLNLKKPKYVPPNFYASMPRAHVRPEDILLCKDGARSGKVAYVPDTFAQDAMVNEHVFIIRTTDVGRQHLSPWYLFLALFSREGFAAVRSSMRGSAQGGISEDRLAAVEVAVPDLVTQQTITRRVGPVPENGFPLPDLASPSAASTPTVLPDAEAA